MGLFQGKRDVRPALHDGPIAMLHGLLRAEECAAVAEMMERLPKTIGRVDQNEHKESVRRSDIRWLHFNDPEPLHQQAAQFLMSTLAQVNQDFFKFELEDVEPIQLTHYLGDVQGTYGWHQDGYFHGAGGNPVRKLSMVIQLSSPSDYEGGGLELQASSNLVTVPPELGLAVFFPSPMLHRVLPVTRGNRRSLVAWARGPNFR